MAFRRTGTEGVASRDLAVIVKKDYRGRAFQDDKRLRLGRLKVAMRPYVGTAKQDVEKPVRIVRRTQMEIVVHAESRRGSRLCRHGIEEQRGDQLYRAQCLSHFSRVVQRRFD